MAFRDLSEVLDAGLSLPINGKTYVVPPVDAETGLRLQRLAELAATVAHAVEAGEQIDTVALDDAGEIDLYRDALGTVYDEMIADRVSWPALKLAGVTAWLDAAVGREAAEAYWNGAGSPEAPAGNRATRQAARSTRQPVSGSGTTRTRTATPKAGTPGRRSSTTGR
ncbi:DUF7426 family protein [Actinocrispum wychmicini]|uniref:DUF7426 domain-containing protein n=1 Tax=Actinocrispum wychmicini TaxID=1213861 RepID=A0A4R2K3P2_9PSEU|nr:hypothetical protein [Actinocrispum wychmicini]TCO64389.1 hypothetical protein EV192_101157 [Actinocrispum wychmicini]